MIIQALCAYYDRLLSDPESGISPPGYSKAKVGYGLILSVQGELLNIIDLRVTRGKKLVSRELVVPEQLKRASGIAPNFLCDNCCYVLGLDAKGKPERAQLQFREFRTHQHELLDDVQDVGATAVLRFLDGWDPARAANNPIVKEQSDGLVEGGNIVFLLAGTTEYVHTRPAIRTVWGRYKENAIGSKVGRCLVTGEQGPIARLHPNIKGVADAQSTGACLVSFDKTAFTSYGKEQSYNAPISQTATFAYTTALNYLLAGEKHRMRIADTTVVFWAERTGPGVEEDIFAELFDPSWSSSEAGKGEEPRRDPETTKLVRDILMRVRAGQSITDDMNQFDPKARFYILGLAPNASRLAVRFWHVDSFGRIIEKISRHYTHMAIEKSWATDPDFIPLWQLLKESAPLGDVNNISPLLAGALTRAILLGLPYPQSLYTSTLSRIRADQKVTYARAAMLKACLIHNFIHKDQQREVIESMNLSEKNTEVSYRLGRLFALLEKAQQDANTGINATIRDRYFGAASATPRAVFPLLLRLAQHHIAKAEYGFALDKKVEDIIALIDGFPAHLNLEEQGLFVLGYYHQRNALYKKINVKGENSNGTDQ